MSDIKVKSFIGAQIKTEFAAPGLWRLAEDVYVYVHTEKDGILRYAMKKGFLTDMRSGSHAIDGIIPKFTGNNQYNLAILCHDFGYTRNKEGEHYVSRLLADQLLREMVQVSGELGSFKAALMYNAVRLFGGSAYESQNSEDYNGIYANAADYMKFKW